MQFNQTEIKDLTAVITLTVEPADYQEAVQKELINRSEEHTSELQSP